MSSKTKTQLEFQSGMECLYLEWEEGMDISTPVPVKIVSELEDWCEVVFKENGSIRFVPKSLLIK